MPTMSCRRSRGACFLLGMLAAATTLFRIAECGQTNITSLCSPHATPPLLKKGDATYVCVNVNDNFRAVFMPVADKFTVLRVTDSWSDPRIGANPNGAYVSVSSGALRSYFKLFASDAGRVYPYMTVIISVKKGVVRFQNTGLPFLSNGAGSNEPLCFACAFLQIQGVTWDDGSYFRDPDTCEPNLYSSAVNTSTSKVADSGYACYSSLAGCSGENATTCDLTLYVGWTGTDKSGNYLSSAGLRMSQFKKIANSFSDLLPSSRFDS